ncbi:MAG: alpha/beta hydrolase family protein [Rhodospirillaceae bacterium]|nr:alpha/beta hydrolase family protein [Rhodospirillaceae bacterium]
MSSRRQRAGAVTEAAGAAMSGALRATARFPRTGSVLHGVLARPWIDPICLWGFRKLLPTSRAWAAASISGGSPETFAAALELRAVPSRIAPRLAETVRLRERSTSAEVLWRALAFEGGNGDLLGAERARRMAAQNYLANRVKYLWLAKSRRVPAVRYQTPSPQAALAAFQASLPDADALFRLPDPLPPVARSRIVDHGDVLEYWLRFASPGSGDDAADTCYAHVYEPKRSGPRGMPTLFFGHGLAMELEMMVDGPRSFKDMAAHGMRIVMPDGPGHNRRCKPGLYGGESFLVEPPVSGIHHFIRAAREFGTLIAWCRAQGPGKIALGGVSLGALSAQVAASRSRYWPAEARPDALCLLTTTSQVSGLALDSSLGQMADLDNEVRRCGWKPEHFAALAPITDAGDEPPVDPANIVLLIGARDNVTPTAGGRSLAGMWRIPPENLFVRDQGHFSAAIGLGVDPAPYARMFEILSR